MHRFVIIVLLLLSLLVPGIVRAALGAESMPTVTDLNQLEATLPIDSHRVYVTGFSNGAGMTFTLGGHFSDRIAAIAPVSSQSFTKAELLARPLPVYYLTGTATTARDRWNPCHRRFADQHWIRSMRRTGFGIFS